MIIYYSHAEYNMLNIMLSIIILCVCLPACYNFPCKAQHCRLNALHGYSLEPDTVFC